MQSSNSTQEGSSSSSSSHSRSRSQLEAKATKRIEQLDREYNNLKNAESILLQELQTLREDQARLTKALAESKESGREKMERQKNERNEEAIRNLQAALMADDDDDDESDIESGRGGVLASDSISALGYELWRQDCDNIDIILYMH